MRIRQIKPGICSNEEIAALGPYAYILFTGLWMIADKEGRFEWRPKRIKALVMPLWDEVPAETEENINNLACGNPVEKSVEILLKTLAASGLIHRYEVAGKPYGVVTNWKKHQRLDPREARSEIPAPPLSAAVAATSSEQCNSAELQRQDSGIMLGCWDLGNGSTPPFGRRTARARRARNPPPSDKHPERKPQTEPAPEQPAERKSPDSEQQRESPPKVQSTSAIDFWPHAPDDVVLIRNSLTELAQHVRLPPPDDELVRRVLDVGRGHGGQEIQAALVELFRRQKFRDMRSWGFVPLVIGQWFKTGVVH